MKTKLSLTLLLSLVFYLLSSQVPQGFNYQAVARDASGFPIKNHSLPVRITIQSDSLSGTIFWQELHPAIITSDLGVINLVLGKGARQSSSTVATFSNIDWSVTPKFLKIEIDNSGWKTLGVSRLWSVPYALVAGDLDGPIEKLAIEGETTQQEEALFEVKNKDGQTVFAVYNEGVRVYVSDGAKALKGGFAVGGFGTDKAESTKYLFVGKDSVRIYLETNPLTKKLKGGFAVGGYDLTKGTVQNYLDVNADSVRIYIDSDPTTKKLKGGFAVGGYDMTKGTNTNYMNVNTDASGIINPSQNRILWYPLKNAFLTGRVRIGTPDSVGVNSFATGYESKSRGMYSQALGFKAIANGDYSTAIGKNAVADKINSFAFGDSARAINAESYAIGRGAIASGYRSFAFGSAGVDTLGNVTDISSALGDYSFAIGQGSKSIGKGSFSMGIADTAQGDFSLAIGYKTKADGHLATALGFNTVASGIYSTAMGYVTSASGNSATAMGYVTSASGNSATAMGRGTSASGNWATAMGLDTKSSGSISTALGSSTNAIGWASIASGFKSTAKGSASLAMGYMTNTRGDFATAMGYYTTAGAYCHVFGRNNDTVNSGSPNWFNDDPLFMIGNGTSNSARSNALTVLKNGMTAIGNRWPTQMLDVNGNARFRSVGSGTFSYNLNITSDGTLTTATSDASMKENIQQISNALGQVNRIRGVSFTWKNDSTSTRQLGMIAQEVEVVVPEIVFTNPVDGLKGINYSQATALLIEAIKEQQYQIESYKTENDNLRSQFQILQEKVDKIETLLAKEIDE